MIEIQEILLDDCDGDRVQMLSHLHQLWQEEKLNQCWIRGLPLGDLEEDIGYIIPPGMEEGPFILFLQNAEVESFELENEELVIEANPFSGQIIAVCDTPLSLAWAKELQKTVQNLSGPLLRAEPELRIWQPAVRLQMEDPLAELSARALAFPSFSRGLMAASRGADSFVHCTHPLPVGSGGIFYGWNEEDRSLILYDSFSDQLICCGAGKDVLKE